MLLPTRLQVDEKQYDAKTDNALGRQEVERRGTVMRRHGVDDGAGDDGTDERRGFANYVEEGEEKKVFASRLCEVFPKSVFDSFEEDKARSETRWRRKSFQDVYQDSTSGQDTGKQSQKNNNLPSLRRSVGIHKFVKS